MADPTTEGAARRDEGEPATPAGAIARLRQMSADVRSALVLDSGGALAAASDGAHGEAMRGVALELLEHADAAVDDEVVQVEVTAPGGAVFCAREGGWTLVAVTEGDALSSLMFYDIRSVLNELAGAGGAPA